MAKDGGAHTGILAERLGLAPGTVTATVKRLADRGLVDHEPYHGVELTIAGRRLSESLRLGKTRRLPQRILGMRT